MIRATTRNLAILAAPLALVACGGGAGGNDQSLDALDAELAGNAADPAVTAALQDQIMVDPSLAQQSNEDAVRPPQRPYAAPVPGDGVAAGSAEQREQLMSAPAPGECTACAAGREAVTLAQLAESQKAGAARGCGTELNYAAGWANRLPADLPLHPDARVGEAAGVDTRGCRMRVVSFTVGRPLGHMVDWYYTRARRGGYTAEHQAAGGDHVLGGTRQRDDGAYMIFLSPAANDRTAIDLIVNTRS